MRSRCCTLLHRSFLSLCLLLLGFSTFPAAEADADRSFWNFETGQVRPLAMSPDGTRLFAVNTPDSQLEIFDITASCDPGSF